MTFKTLRRPVWSRRFIEEPEEVHHIRPKSRQGAPWRAIMLCALSLVGLGLQLSLLSTVREKSWNICSVAGWVIVLTAGLLLRPQAFSLMLLTLFLGLFASQSVLCLKAWRQAYDMKLHLTIGTTVVAFLGMTNTLNMPMREPGWSKFGISKPFSQPTDKCRSPEDNLTFWQWMTISWVSPLLRLGRQRQLNEEDVWLLPYEFQHAFLHDAFRRLKGSVLKRLLVANWIDLLILTALELIEVITNYSEPVLLQQLLKAMQHLREDKQPALIYAFLMLLVRLINAQSEVFSLWYGRRCYERSRGEMITMLYEKTLHRKIVAQLNLEGEEELTSDGDLARVTSTRSASENTPLLSNGVESKPTWFQSMVTHLKNVHVNFWIGFKGVDAKKQEPAAMGKIMNLMRYDSYEVSQRFWDFQKLIEKPLGLIISLVLIWRLLGWPALVGIAVVIVAQVSNYLFALVSVRFEKTRRFATDQRLQQSSQYIESIRHLRWYGWQEHWLKNVYKARQKELNVRLVSYLWSLTIIFNNIFGPGLVTIAAFWAYTILAEKDLSVDIVFPALQIFNMLQDDMGEIPELIQTLLNAYVALNRIQVFMDEPEKNDDDGDERRFDGEIELRNASFAWPGLQQNVLHSLNVKFGAGVTVVAGEVASGKSALLQALLGELDATGGDVLKPSSPMAYCSQTPWLQSMTIRDNILFNSPFEPERYKNTIQACALIPDLASFEKGDLSPIGENGIGLSGGQKARVALARAIYSHESTILLDDPLSALDQQTSEQIVAQCFRGELLKDRTVILVTHRTDLCEPIAYQVITMKMGRATSQIQDPLSIPDGSDDVVNGEVSFLPFLTRNDSKLIKEAIPEKFEEEEKRAHGDIDSRIYWEYLKAGNLAWWAVVLLTILVTRLVQTGTTWYLKEFSEAYSRPESRDIPYVLRNNVFTVEWQVPFLRHLFDSLPSPSDNVVPWLEGLFILAISQAVTFCLTNGAIMVTRYLAGKNLFRAVMEKVTGTTFRYYDITPVGRLMNRLTSDMGQVDSGTGWDVFHIFWQGITWVVSLVVIASVTPLFLAVSVLVSVGYALIFFQFLPASQSLRRLETVSLSPLMTNFGALLTGLTTVRAFKAENRFQGKLIKVVDTFQGMDHFYWSVQSWLSYRMEIMSALSTLLLTVIAIYTNLSAGLTAFVLISAQKFVQTTHGLCRAYGKLQVNFVSVERVVELLDLEQEYTNPVPPPSWWPSFGGNILFENVSIRYAPHLEPALTDVSFELKGGTNTAVVGRTGSGKSTLAAALLATVPVDKGRILIDGIDLATIDKQALRSRVTFLAQEPVLFEGSLRHNLDPTKKHSDVECEDVIRRIAGKFSWSLTTHIEAGGKNLSQGQRQLVGLARAILRRSSVIIMDEATASIDVETAWDIQRVLREELKESTVITIAHRTTAVRDADNAIVLVEGKLASFGPANEAATSAMEDGSDQESL